MDVDKPDEKKDSSSPPSVENKPDPRPIEKIPGPNFKPNGPHQMQPPSGLPQQISPHPPMNQGNYYFI